MSLIELIEKNILRYNGKPITVVFDLYSDPWWKAKDIAEAINYIDTDDAVRRHVHDEDKTRYHSIRNPGCEPGLHPNTIFINESGLYALIFGSELPAAKLFKHWVTSEVLPSIRKYGEYKLKLVHKKELTLKDMTIEDLNQKIKGLKMDRTDPTQDEKKHHQLILIKKNITDDFPYYVLRIQKCNRENRIGELKVDFPDLEVILSITVPNSITLYNRMKEQLPIEWIGNHFFAYLDEDKLKQKILNLHINSSD